jgi:hypothetical protein
MLMLTYWEIPVNRINGSLNYWINKFELVVFQGGCIVLVIYYLDVTLSGS